MIAGFTGTQVGCSEPQALSLAALFVRLGIEQLHHGDCIGADETAHKIFRSIYHLTPPTGAVGLVIGHPPTVRNKRAFCDFDEIRDERPYLDRNKDIVRESQVLIACPQGAEELRSGTWSTIRYARRLGRPIYIVWPSGEVTEENVPKAA